MLPQQRACTLGLALALIAIAFGPYLAGAGGGPRIATYDVGIDTSALPPTRVARTNENLSIDLPLYNRDLSNQSEEINGTVLITNQMGYPVYSESQPDIGPIAPNSSVTVHFTEFRTPAASSRFTIRFVIDAGLGDTDPTNNEYTILLIVSEFDVDLGLDPPGQLGRVESQPALPISIDVLVVNYGVNAAGPASVRFVCRQGSSEVANLTSPVSALDPGASEWTAFGPWTTPASYGEYDCMYMIDLAGDENPANDLASFVLVQSNYSGMEIEGITTNPSTDLKDGDIVSISVTVYNGESVDFIDVFLDCNVSKVPDMSSPYFLCYSSSASIGPIPSGGRLTHTFDSPWYVPEGIKGEYTINAGVRVGAPDQPFTSTWTEHVWVTATEVDVGVDKLTGPYPGGATIINSTQVMFTAVVTNHATTTPASVPITWEITRNGAQDLLRNVSLGAIAPGESVNATLNYTLYDGDYRIAVRTALEGDEDPSNDQMFLYYHVYGGGQVQSVIDISLDPVVAYGTPGFVCSFNVSVTNSGDASDVVDLSVTGLAQGLTGSLSPERIELNGHSTSYARLDVLLSPSISDGVYTFTVKAVPAEAAAVEEVGRISIGTNPVAVIASPMDGSEFSDSDQIIFDGSFSTVGGNAVITSYTWTSSLQGWLGSTKHFIARLDVGRHEITLRVEDSIGRSHAQTVKVNVYGGASGHHLEGGVGGYLYIQTYKPCNVTVVGVAGGTSPLPYGKSALGIFRASIDHLPADVRSTDLMASYAPELESNYTESSLDIWFVSAANEWTASLASLDTGMNELKAHFNGLPGGAGTTGSLLFALLGDPKGSGPSGGQPVLVDLGENISVALGEEFRVTAYVFNAEPPLSIRWEFGDGSEATTAETTVTHAYNESGSFVIRATVSAGNRSGSDQVTVTVVQIPSSVGFRTSLVGDIVTGKSVTYTAVVEGTATPTAYSWDMGDGTTGTEREIKHTYRLPGNYTIRLIVDTDQGRLYHNRTIEVKQGEEDSTHTERVVSLVSNPYIWLVILLILIAVVALVILILKRPFTGTTSPQEAGEVSPEEEEEEG